MTYRPPRGLSNAHLQTILSSIGPRRLRLRKAAERLQAAQDDMILNCHDGIRLSGTYNRAHPVPSQQLAILIHGWEGSAQSSYMLSLADQLLRSGIDVFRLNLRDHGDSHHLNRGIFNSTLVPEVVTGLQDLQQRLPYQHYSLIGFSLGGNFALRVAALADAHALPLTRVIAFCPALHAKRSNTVLNSRANYVYGQYFVRKWKRSLRKKLDHFPDYGYGAELGKMRSLDQMNRRFIPDYTEFKNVDDYFDAYAITGAMLERTACPCYLHFAKDDMIIPWQDVAQLADNPDLHITITEHGGHCGFVSNWKFDSWQDQRALELMHQNVERATQ